MTDAVLLAIRDVRLSFGGVIALDGASLEVPQGSITGLIGPNGAGKSTLINVITGLLRPLAGAVSFDGREIGGWPPEKVCQAGLARTFQIARGFPRLTVLENLMLHGRDQVGESLLQALFLRRFGAQEAALRAQARDVAARLRLTTVLNNPASDLSGGQKKLLEIGRALMSKPKLVLLDEPAAGVNPTLSREIGERLIELRQDGQTFLIVEHDMGLVEQICDRVVVMAVGRRLAQGTFAEIRADARVQEAYLGQVIEEAST